MSRALPNSNVVPGYSIFPGRSTKCTSVDLWCAKNSPKCRALNTAVKLYSLKCHRAMYSEESFYYSTECKTGWKRYLTRKNISVHLDKETLYALLSLCDGNPLSSISAWSFQNFSSVMRLLIFRDSFSMKLCQWLHKLKNNITNFCFYFTCNRHWLMGFKTSRRLYIFSICQCRFALQSVNSILPHVIYILKL